MVDHIECGCRVLRSDADLAPQITEAGAEYCPYYAVAPRDGTIRHNAPGESELDRVLRVIYLNPQYRDDLLAAVARETPDVLLVDSLLMTAAAAAEHTRLHYVGPLACLPQSRPPYPVPWPPDDARPLVLVSYSTSFQNQVPVLQRLAEAVAPLPVRVLLTLGHRITADELRLPPNVVAETFVPHAAVLAQTRLVVTHAGHGTVMAATTAGVPMVCTPMGRDQYAVSSCVERLGLGRAASMTASPGALRQTLVVALADEAMHTHARTWAAGLDVEAGLAHALTVLETL